MSWDDDRKVSPHDRRQQVLALLSDYQWHSTAEINSARVGGSDGTRRLRELRSKKYGGYTIRMRKHLGHDDYEYQLQRPVSLG